VRLVLAEGRDKWTSRRDCRWRLGGGIVVGGAVCRSSPSNLVSRDTHVVLFGTKLPNRDVRARRCPDRRPSRSADDMKGNVICPPLQSRQFRALHEAFPSVLVGTRIFLAVSTRRGPLETNSLINRLVLSAHPYRLVCLQSFGSERKPSLAFDLVLLRHISTRGPRG